MYIQYITRCMSENSAVYYYMYNVEGIQNIASKLLHLL